MFPSEQETDISSVLQLVQQPWVDKGSTLSGWCWCQMWGDSWVSKDKRKKTCRHTEREDIIQTEMKDSLWQWLESASVLFLLLHFFHLSYAVCLLRAFLLLFLHCFSFLWFLISFQSYFFLKKRETWHLKAEREVQPKRNYTFAPSIISYLLENE